jgi:hypothetical protein
MALQGFQPSYHPTPRFKVLWNELQKWANEEQGRRHALLILPTHYISIIDIHCEDQ